MGFDPFSPISPASLNVLLVPAGRIQPDRFEKLVSQILEHSIVSLGDIVANERIAKRPGLFSPTVFAAGRVLLNYSTSVTTQWVDSFPFELNRTPQVIVALAEELDSVLPATNAQEDAPAASSGHGAMLDNLLKVFRESVDHDQRPLVHYLAVFERAASKSDRKLAWCSITGERQSGDVPHLVCSFTASVLDVFDDLAKDYKGVMIPSPCLIIPGKIKAQLHNSNGVFPLPNRLTNDSSHASTTTNGVEATTDSGDTSRSASRSRFGFASPKTATSNDSLPDNSRARYQILLGTLYLQAGRWPDSLRELSEGASATRGHVIDTAWHAHALECLLVCMIMFAWAQLDFNIPQICFTSVDKNLGGRWASLTSQVNGNTSAESSVASPHSLAKLVPGIHDAIMALHMNVSSTAQEQLPPLMIAELRIRLADILGVICLQGGTLTTTALAHLVTGAALHRANPAQPGPPAVSLRKHLIAGLLAEVVEHLPSNCPPKSSIGILIAVSSGLSRLGMKRLQAFYLKSLLQKLIPGLIDARKIGAAELGIHPAAALSLQGSAANGTSQRVRSGVKSILESACEAYELPRVLINDDASVFVSPNLTDVKNSVLQWSGVHASGDFLVKLEVLRICASVCEALPDLPSGLLYITQLLRCGKRYITVSSNPKNDIPLISQEEQMRLLNNLKRTVTAANKLGMPSLRARYWDDFLVRGIELLEPHSSERLIPHTSQELSFITRAAKNGAKDPFIYNPFAKYQQSNNAAAVLVANEIAYFSVILQNPFEFDVEVDSISILAEGCEFEASSHNIVLGHCCCQRFILSGIPRAEGPLRILGCKARIKDCHEQNFWILPRPFLPPRVSKQRRKAPSTTYPPVPNPSSDVEPTKVPVEAPNSDTGFSASILAMDVIREQPSISVEHTSLSLSSLMLLEGETRRLDITLRNNAAKASADLLLFTFDDSVTRQVQEALANKSLGPLELYELQLQLLERPALKWLPDGDTEERPSIQPGQSRTFAFEITGKPGLMDGTIQIDYASVGRPRSEIKEKFHTRQILLPVAITVNGSIEIPRCNVLPFFDRQMGATTTSSDAKIDDENAGFDGQCLVLLDFRNVWPYPITISMQTPEARAPRDLAHAGWSSNRGTSEILQPGHVSRRVLVISRAFVAEPHAPIPTIGAQRQFVVSASKMSIEAEASSREAFWYREELLKSVKATWTEQETGRHGIIDIRRGIRLSARMIEAFKIEPVDIRFMVPNTSPTPANKNKAESMHVSGTSPFLLPVGRFIKIVVKVHNRSQGKLRLLLRLQPSLRDQPHTVALDLSKRFAWSGMLQRPLQPALEPGEVREEELGITALASGHFEISATVEEIKSGKPGRLLAGIDPVSVGAERMIWHAREQFLINAVE
jgi:hypothetical protein